ncbi:hypothetical protein GYH30_003050 [Glycine max]|nr:hypothetical protein GYH30_003050 [Glycine max]
MHYTLHLRLILVNFVIFEQIGRAQNKLYYTSNF